MAEPAPAPVSRFLTLPQVQDELAISASQTYALIRSRALRAIKVGGRGQYRVERTELEAYIERAYADTEQFLKDNPHGRQAGEDTEPDTEPDIDAAGGTDGP